jgi:hypothetical protein
MNSRKGLPYKYFASKYNCLLQKWDAPEVIQLGLFDQVNLVEFESEDYPDERLIACRNPLIAQKNQLQREALLEAVEKELDFPHFSQIELGS